MSVKSAVKAFVKNNLPAVWQARAYRKYLVADYGEPEIHIIGQLVDPDRHALDIGVHEGIYTRQLARHAKGVIGFEANPDSADFASRALRGVAEIRHAALSDSEGVAVLRVPRAGARGAEAALGTISTVNALNGADVREVQVPMKRLDDFDLPLVGLVKIDVEGHEEAVLRGGTALLARDRPVYMIEIEERHNPGAIGRVVDYFTGHGYVVKCLDGGQLKTLDREAAIAAGERLNNYFFVPQ